MWALEHQLGSCRAQALFAPLKWDLPRPGMEPTSPALAGGFLNAGPQGSHYSEHLCTESLILWPDRSLHGPWQGGSGP